MCLISKYTTQIKSLEDSQHSNQTLWNQLQESDKRERVLRQELASTQSSLHTAQLKIEAQHNEIKGLENEKQRLLKFKAQRVDHVRDLEDKVKKLEVFNNVDGDKLITALSNKE